jgi:hypothetical protein
MSNSRIIICTEQAQIDLLAQAEVDALEAQAATHGVPLSTYCQDVLRKAIASSAKLTVRSLGKEPVVEVQRVVRVHEKQPE